MIAIRRSNVTVAAATALVALSLSLPASAEQSAPASQPAVEAPQANAAEVPTPRVRPPVRKRTAKPVSMRRYAQPVRPYWFYRPYVQQVAVHWPILFVGVGY